jgi:hypothetical protein
MRKHKKYIILWSIALLIVSLSGCGSSNSSSNSGSPGSQNGILSVSLTDAPASGFDAVNVTVSEVRVHKSAMASENAAGWFDITLNPPRKINLLGLTNGVLESLGQTPLPAGHYTQLRLVLSMNTGTNPLANSVVLSGETTTTELPLDTPSAIQSGIKLIHEFDVAPGQRVDLVLDFDALKSVVCRGNGTYLLKPVIHIVPTALTGIDGFVDTSLLGDNVMVSSEVSGTVVRSTVPDPQTGEFIIDHLAPGSYDLVITADGHATAVIAGVPVSAATSTALMTMVSTSAEPISMPTSTMHNISGTVMTSPTSSTTTVASVASLQTFTAGPTVTVKSTTADLTSSGTYTIALPIAAPLLGQYGTGTLPISFTPQPDVAGKYTAEASADGYQTQAVEVDISIADVVQNFTLTP